MTFDSLLVKFWYELETWKRFSEIQIKMHLLFVQV